MYHYLSGSVAQSAEQEPFKLKVVGSIPTRPTQYPFVLFLKIAVGVLNIILKSR